MKFPFFKSKREWPSSPDIDETTPMDDNNFFTNRPAPSSVTTNTMKIGAIFLFGFLIYITNGAAWAVRLTMCTLFCSLIYTRDASPSGRWIAIGIITVGTLLSILLPLTGIGASLLRSVF